MMPSNQSGNVGKRYGKKRKKQKIETLTLPQTMNVPEISEELLKRILIKLQVKPLMRFKCVSKHWLSLISSPYFTNQFHKLNPLRTVRFFAYLVDKQNLKHHAWFTSSSPLSSPSIMMNQDSTLPRIKGYFWSVSGGLVCFRNGANVQVLNPHTGKSTEYPTMRSEMVRSNINNVMNYIGYNPVQDVYKVLSVAWEYKSETAEHQWLVLGAGTPWRKFDCPFPHRPSSSLISKTVNGVLYYGAEAERWGYVLVSFDLTSEELLTFTKLPVKTYGFLHNLLMDYQGKLAFMDHQCGGGTVHVWVLEDAKKSQWSVKMTFLLPISELNLINECYRIGATSRSGQVWLTKEARSSRKHKKGNKSFSFIIFDLERNEITQRIETGPLPGNFMWSLSTFWDYECI